MPARGSKKDDPASDPLPYMQLAKETLDHFVPCYGAYVFGESPNVPKEDEIAMDHVPFAVKREIEIAIVEAARFLAASFRKLKPVDE